MFGCGVLCALAMGIPVTSLGTGKSRRAAGSKLIDPGLVLSLPKLNASEIYLITSS